MTEKPQGRFVWFPTNRSDHFCLPPDIVDSLPLGTVWMCQHEFRRTPRMCGRLWRLVGKKHQDGIWKRLIPVNPLWWWLRWRYL
jgi:hypothetical protein